MLTPMGWGCQPSPSPRIPGPLQTPTPHNVRVYPTNYLAKMRINIGSRVAWLGEGVGALGMRVNVLTPMGRGYMPPTPTVRGARVTHTLLPSTTNMLTPPFILPIYILV
jgi:hypothetical protein